MKLYRCNDESLVRYHRRRCHNLTLSRRGMEMFQVVVILLLLLVNDDCFWNSKNYRIIVVVDAMTTDNTDNPDNTNNQMDDGTTKADQDGEEQSSSSTTTTAEEEDDSTNLHLDDDGENNPRQQQDKEVLHGDTVEDSLYDPLQIDPSCYDDGDDSDCYQPPESTLITETKTITKIDATCLQGKGSSDDEDGTTDGGNAGQTCLASTVEEEFDPHWGTDERILLMRDKLRQMGSGLSSRAKAAQAAANKEGTDSDDGNGDKQNAETNDNTNNENEVNRRPPIFLLPGLASTRLVAWKYKKCPGGALSPDVKVQENVWLNLNLVIRMGTVDVHCMTECLRLGVNQTDTDDYLRGCKLRPEEGLDAIASLAPGGIGSNMLIGGTNTVYAWLVQWLADNLGYDVGSIVGLPYDWRLSPDKMESRDGFLTMMRRRMEAAVKTNKQPGIVIAHSMGNLVFRYFLEWLRIEMRTEAFHEFVKRDTKKRAYERRLQKVTEAAEAAAAQQQQQQMASSTSSSTTASTGASSSQPMKPAASTQTQQDSSYFSGWISGDWWASSSESANEEEAADEATAEEDKEEMQKPAEEEVTKTHDEIQQQQQQQQQQKQQQARQQQENQEVLVRHLQLWELAKIEGDTNWLEWLETHVWTYVGLSAPMLGAVNPLRAMISGENMGLPITDEIARSMEITFGSTLTIMPLSSKTGFCDDWNADRWDEEAVKLYMDDDENAHDKRLACLDDIMTDIDISGVTRDPWKDFPTLKALLLDRIDWDYGRPMIQVDMDECTGVKQKQQCVTKNSTGVGPKDVQSGDIFSYFATMWREEKDPLIVKREQLRESFWDTSVPNILNRTWDRPLIKHVIMAYGVDIPTENGYIYSKKTFKDPKAVGQASKFDGVPSLKTVIWEDPNGKITTEHISAARGGVADTLIKKKPKRGRLEGADQKLLHSGDGSVPYLSLAWAHTWLLHAARAKRFSENDVRRDRKNTLDHIEVSHRPLGATEWVPGPPPMKVKTVDELKLVEDPDTGTSHPHGTRYKPEMIRYHNVGTSRTTGIEYTTSVIEAIGVEHKETTRNYDILAAVFTDVLKYMSDDFGLV